MVPNFYHLAIVITVESWVGRDKIVKQDERTVLMKNVSQKTAVLQ